MPKTKKAKQTNTNKKTARKSTSMKKQKKSAASKATAKNTKKTTAQKKKTNTQTKSAAKSSPKKTQKTTTPKTSVKAETKQEMSQPKTQNTKSLKPSLNKQTIVLSVVVVLIAVAYIFRGVFIAAMVNGQPISRLRVVREAEQMQGRQILENMVMEALIEQKAREKGIQISNEMVNAQIDEIKEGVAEQGQDFDQLMALQGLTIEELQRQIRMQQMIEVMVGEDLEVSEEEIEEYLENNRDFLPEDMDQEELEELARQQLQQQQMSQKYQDWMTDLKEEASIRYFVGYGGEEEIMF